jgi:hypothetical protein
MPSTFSITNTRGLKCSTCFRNSWYRWILDEPPTAVVRAVPLAGAAEALAGRSADDHIDGVVPDQPGQILRMELRQVLLKDVGDRVADVPDALGSRCSEVLASGLHGLAVEVHRGQHVEAGPHHPEAEPATAAEQVDTRHCPLGCIALEASRGGGARV